MSVLDNLAGEVVVVIVVMSINCDIFCVFLAKQREIRRIHTHLLWMTVATHVMI